MISRLKHAALCCLMVAMTAGTAIAERAHFVVRDEVVNPDLPAFTATVSDFGNGADLMKGGGGFEPSVFRNMIRAEKDSLNSIEASPAAISNWDSWPEGVFDGAEVEVLRIVDGKFETVRRDRVAPGGYHASGWLPMADGKVLAPEQTRYGSSWEGYNRLGGPWYYTVRAVDAKGNLSPPAQVASVISPMKPGKVENKSTFSPLKVNGGVAKALHAPANFQAKVTISQTLLLTWDPVPGAAGYVLYRADLPPEKQRGYSIELEGEGAPIKAGDMVLLRKKFYLPRRDQIATNRIWKASGVNQTFGTALVPGLPGDDPSGPEFRLMPHPADTPVSEPGETYLEVDLKGGQALPLGRYNYSGIKQDYYAVFDPTKTYRFEVWLRGEGDVTATFRLTGPLSKMPGQPASVRPGPEWRRYVLDFRVPSTFESTQVGETQIVLSGTGRVDVDNFRLYRADAPFMDLLPEDRTELELSGMGALRTHMFIKSGVATYDLAQLTNPAGVSPIYEGNSLPQFLKICASVGTLPWIQLEPHLTREEWLGFAEYLAAPFDPAKDDPKALPWAAKRVAQGRQAPWTDAFAQIYFEIGNETWNGMFAPWNFPEMRDGGTLNWTKYGTGEVYGLYQEHVLSILRDSPWWDRLAPKLEPVLGGWIINDYGFSALKHSPSSRAETLADYLGGWDAGEGPVRPTPEGFASVMAFTPQVAIPNAEAEHERLRKTGREGDVILGTYEAGPGYALNGLNGSSVSPEQWDEQEKVMKGAAAGAATLDNFLARAQVGDRIQNFFLMKRGEGWSSHAKWYKGGQAYPSWEWLALYNNVGLGDVLAVDTVEVPRRDLAALKRRQPMEGAPMAAAYASRKGTRLTVAVISRAVPNVPVGSDGRMSVEVDLPISGASRLTRYHATGDYTSENTQSRQTRVIAETLPVSSDPARLVIPDMAPASAEIYVFEGVTPVPSR